MNGNLNLIPSWKQNNEMKQKKIVETKEKKRKTQVKLHDEEITLRINQFQVMII